jgi:phosphatidylglycerophosphate synthase
MTPNMVTVTSVICQLLGLVVILYYDTTLTYQFSNYFYFFFVTLLFLAQTFDAVDGIHARNTDRCSPLGQLMDHGCDAFSNSFAIIILSQAHVFGATNYTIICQAVVQVN